jgi:hypothetical protein
MIVAAFVQIPDDRLIPQGFVLANVELHMLVNALNDPLDIFQPIYTNVKWTLTR